MSKLLGGQNFCHKQKGGDTIQELAYSFHLGSDKNRKPISKNKAKNNVSKTTSLSNNAIQNTNDLSKVDKHNYRKYDNKQDEIVIVRGTSSLFNDVENLYRVEFEDARLEYNSQQVRSDRKIDNYFLNVSNNDKKDLACEIIIELGDKEFWDTKDINFKKRMTSVYSKQIEDLEKIVPNFKVASSIIHYDETSPHIHIVGVPIKDKNKNGMSKQVGKSDVFTKSSLTKIQDKMRSLCIEEFNKEYGLSYKLKTKEVGRNEDINVKDMNNYIEMKKEIKKNKERLNVINEKSKELDTSTNDIKEVINNLNKIPVIKDSYVIKESDKDKIVNYLDKVDKTNNEYKNVNKLSITLNDIDNEISKKNKVIRNLVEENSEFHREIDELNEKIYYKSKEILDKDLVIAKLEDENNNLKKKLKYYVDKFKKLVNHFIHKMFKKDREIYNNVAVDLYEHDILGEDELKEIRFNYIESHSNSYENKDKDDFEL